MCKMLHAIISNMVKHSLAWCRRCVWKQGWIVLKWIDPFCLSDFWSRLKCKWEARDVRLSSWHSDKCPSAITPQTPLQQFHSDYTTHPVTFTSEHGPRMQKVSNFWTEHLFISSFRRLGGPRGSIWIFCLSALCFCLRWHWRTALSSFHLAVI